VIELNLTPSLKLGLLSCKASTKVNNVLPDTKDWSPRCALQEWSKTQTGLEQYAINKYAEAFEVVPRTLAENSGLNATDVVSALYAAHAQGQATAGAIV
jgi:T-complex protein 1 subunit theta